MAARHFVNETPVRPARVGLHRRATVHRDRRGAGVLHQTGDIRGIDVGVVPPCAHLHGDRNRHRAGHRPDHPRGMLRCSHEAAPSLMLGDLGHWTTHVDVDNVGAHSLDDLRRLCHPTGVTTKNLDRHRPLRLGVLGVFERPVDPTDQPLRADHLGDDQPAPAPPLDQTAEGSVGHPRHRGQRERRLECDRPNLHR